jgi:ComF family protein
LGFCACHGKFNAFFFLNHWFWTPMQILNDFFSLFFPPLCTSCRDLLTRGEACLCTACEIKLPRTGFHRHRENAMTRIFWGRVAIEGATALFYYHKGGGVQEMIYQLKYNGRKDLGHYLGRLLGAEMLESHHFSRLEAIIPVPLHKKRRRQRGFNQSEVFAAGISELTGIPVRSEALVRQTATQTQTRKDRFRRWQNVAGVFDVREPALKGARNLLLVDDVLTTGSTLEACARKLIEAANARVWVATIGFTP